MKPQVYIDPRPAEYFDRYHERVRTQRPDWIYRLARVVLTPPILALYRYRAIDVANVPERGPVLLAPNHFSYLDHFFVAVLLRREVQFMAKSQLFRPPVLDFILNHGGTFPVRRGHRDEEAFITAHSIFDRGGTVLMYAEGGRQRTQGAGPAKAGSRQAGAGVGSAGRADRDPRLRACAGHKARDDAQGHRAVRRAAAVSSRSTIPRASDLRRSPNRSSIECV